MPTPARTAAVVVRIAAPGYARDPATTPTTPRVYLCASGSGTGHSEATSWASSAATGGVFGRARLGSRPQRGAVRGLEPGHRRWCVQREPEVDDLDGARAPC